MRQEQITIKKRYKNNHDIIRELIACDQRLQNLLEDNHYKSFPISNKTTILDILKYINCNEAQSIESENISIYLSVQSDVYNYFKISAKKYTGYTQTVTYLNELLDNYYHMIDADNYFRILETHQLRSFYFLNDTTLKELIHTEYISSDFFISVLLDLKKELKENNTVNIFMKIMTMYQHMLYQEGQLSKDEFQNTNFFYNKLSIEIDFIEKILFLRYKYKFIPKSKFNKIKRLHDKYNKELKKNYKNNIDDFIEKEIKKYYDLSTLNNPVMNRLKLINFKKRLSLQNKEFVEFSNKLSALKPTDTIQLLDNIVIVFNEDNDFVASFE